MREKHLTEKEIFLFLEDNLKKEERGKIEEHLNHCPVCQKEIKEMIEIEESLKKPILIEPPRILLNNIMENLTVNKKIKFEELFISLFIAFSSIMAILLYLISTKGINTLINLIFRKVNIAFFIKNGVSNFNEMLHVIKKLFFILLESPIIRINNHPDTFKIVEFAILTIILLGISIWKKDVVLKRRK